MVPRHPSLKPSWEKRLPPATIAIDDEFDYNEAAVLSQAAPTGAYVPACDDGGGDDETNGNDLFEIDDATQAKLLEMLIAAGSSKEGDMPSRSQEAKQRTPQKEIYRRAQSKKGRSQEAEVLSFNGTEK